MKVCSIKRFKVLSRVKIFQDKTECRMQPEIESLKRPVSRKESSLESDVKSEKH